MSRVTFDTNILVSATIVQGKQHELLLLARQGDLTLLLSQEIIQEFKDTIAEKKFQLSEEQVITAVNSIEKICEIVKPEQHLDIIKEDPEDNKILECALAGKADYIISGDKHLLALKSFKGIKIVNATQFFEMFKNH